MTKLYTTEFPGREYWRQFDLVTASPIRCWQDGIAVGNGALGALFYTAESFFPEWSVNLNSLWDERLDELSHFPAMSEVRKMASGELDFAREMSKCAPIGEGHVPTPVYGAMLRLEPGIAPQHAPGFRVTNRLSLYDAVLETHLDKHLAHPEIRSFVSAKRNVLVIRVSKVSLVTAFHSKVRLFRTEEPGRPAAQVKAQNGVLVLHQTLPTMSFTAAVKVVPTGTSGGGEYREFFEKITHPANWGWSEPTAPGAISPCIDEKSVWCDVNGDFDVYLSLQKDGGESDAVGEVENAAAAGWEALYAEHCAEWAEFWTRNRVDLGDTGLTQLWYLSNYHLRLASGVNPAWGLCGPWFGRVPGVAQSLPWHGFFTNDYNAQTLPLALETVHHGELAEPFYRMLHDQLPQARQNARRYECPGAFYPLNGGPDGKDAAPGWLRFCQGSGPYWCTLLYRHWKYSGDETFLREIAWDILRETARFFAAYLEWNGKEYHLVCSQNPELDYLTYPDPIDTLAFLKATLIAACDVSERLQQAETERARWRHILAHYPAYPVNQYGFSPLRGLRADHVNHHRTLAMVYPVGELDTEFPAGQIEDARKELGNPVWDFFMKTYACPTGFQCGWTGRVYHTALPACRFGEADKAWKFLGDLIGGTLKPNGLFSHNIAILADSDASERNLETIPERSVYHNCGPEPMLLAEVASGRCWEECTEDLECKEKMFPVLEGPAVFLLLLSEMLLQSHNNLVRVFPAWPKERPVKFAGLCAEGGLTVAAELAGGQVQGVRFAAARSGSFALLNPWNQSEVWRNGQKTAAKRHIEFALQAGEEAVFTPTPENWQMTFEVGKESAGAHVLDFGWGRRSFLGKPGFAEYIRTLTSFLKP